MQALMHESTYSRTRPNTYVHLMGPTDRGDAISGILEDLKRLVVVPLSVVGKPVFQYTLQFYL